MNVDLYNNGRYEWFSSIHNCIQVYCNGTEVFLFNSDERLILPNFKVSGRMAK